MNFLKIIVVYLVFINLVAFISMGIDKYKAKHNKWRIKEKLLFLFVLAGGGIGGTCGMYCFHHKTKHWYFRFFFPIITVLEAVLLSYLAVKFHIFPFNI